MLYLDERSLVHCAGNCRLRNSGRAKTALREEKKNPIKFQRGIIPYRTDPGFSICGTIRFAY